MSRIYNNKTAAAAPPLERPMNRYAHRGAHTHKHCLQSKVYDRGRGHGRLRFN